MRITLDVDDDLMAKATALTGVAEVPALVSAALRALVAQESACRLAGLGGSEPDLAAVRRRRLDDA